MVTSTDRPAGMKNRGCGTGLPSASGRNRRVYCSCPKGSLLDILHDTLARHPKGVKEYDLLRLLRRMDLPVFSELEFSDSLALFRAHFLLFHLLYALGDRLHHEQKGHLEIHCLRIILIPWRPAGDGHPERYETLRDYYRDLTKMEEMKRADVDRLIETFWREYFRYHRRPESLEILGLEHTATPAEIKRRFRKLALVHHPDCGGDPETFHRITEAAESLL